MTMKTKRILSVLLVTVLMLSLFSVTAFAENKTYVVSRLGLSVSLPTELLVVTADTPAENEAFNVLQQSKEDTLKKMEANDQYLIAFPQNKSYTISLTARETNSSLNTYNYKLLSKEQIEKMRQSYLSENKYSSVTVTETKQAVVFNCTSNKKIELPTDYIPNSNSVSQVEGTQSESTQAETQPSTVQEATTENITEYNYYEEPTYTNDYSNDYSDDYSDDYSTDLYGNDYQQGQLETMSYAFAPNDEIYATDYYADYNADAEQSNDYNYDENQDTYTSAYDYTYGATEATEYVQQATEPTTAIAETQTAQATQSATTKQETKNNQLSFTVVNGMMYALKMETNTDSISVPQIGVFSTLVNSMEFSELSKPPIAVNVGKIMLVAGALLIVVIAFIFTLYHFKAKRRVNAPEKPINYQEEPYQQEVPPQVVQNRRQRKRLDKEDQQAVNSFFDELKQDGLIDDGTEQSLQSGQPAQKQGVTAVPKVEQTPQQKPKEEAEEENAFDEMYNMAEKPKKKSLKMRFLFSNLEKEEKEDKGFKTPQAYWEKENAEIKQENGVVVPEIEVVEEVSSKQSKKPVNKPIPVEVPAKNTVSVGSKINNQQDNKQVTQPRKPRQPKDQITREFEQDNYWDKYR